MKSWAILETTVTVTSGPSPVQNLTGKYRNRNSHMELPVLITKLERAALIPQDVKYEDVSLPQGPHQRREPARVTGRDEPRPHGNCPDSPLTWASEASGHFLWAKSQADPARTPHWESYISHGLSWFIKWSSAFSLHICFLVINTPPVQAE